MNNGESNDAPNEAGTWVPKDEYQAFKDRQLAEVKRARRSSVMTAIFYALLATGGLLIAVAFIGGLIAPTVTTMGRGQSCTHSSFEDIQFGLSFIGYPLLFITGIFGAIINRAVVRTIGIILIIAIPVVSVVLLFLGIGNALCGV